MAKSKLRIRKVARPATEEGCALEAARQQATSWAWNDAGPVGGLVLREGALTGPATAPDLRERTAAFGEAVLHFVKKIPRGPEFPENARLVDQLVGAGTSIGANYCEADDAVSRKDFKHKIGTCRKESKETMFFLRMIAASEERLRNEARALWREAKELNLIFGAIWRKL
jgi:four helix bundle protein